MKDEELVEFNKKFYGDLVNQNSSLENEELGDISQKTAQELGIATKVTDSIAAKVYKEVASKITSKRVNDATKFMSDVDKRAAVIEAVKEKGGDYASNFSDRLKSGKVAIEELQLLSDRGQLNVESDIGLEGEIDEQGYEASEQRLYNIIDNMAHIWTDKNHPDYFKVSQEKSKLERKLFG